MTKKVWVMIGAILAAAAAVVVVCVVLTGGKSKAYRSIMVYQVNGDATITRERVGEMKAYENLMLQSGDSVAVASDSSVRLKLDDDKYLLAEQDTVMNIVADGSDADARTYIDLQKGSVTSEIQNKLQDGASYEVNTPNSIMAVRGTIFRVDVEVDESKSANTRLTVFQGTVAARAVLPDGTISDEEVLVEAGKELTIEGTPEAFEDLGEPGEIDYDSLPESITDYLQELKQSGQNIAMNTAQNAPKAQEQPKEQNAKAQEQEPQKADTVEEPKPLKEEQQAGENDVKPEENQPKEPQKTQKKQPEAPQKPQEPQMPDLQPLPQDKTEPQEPAVQEVEPKKPQPNPTPAPSPNPGSQDSDSNGDEDSQHSGGGSKKKTQYYTVTFQYNGSTFATQRVKKGETAKEPKLCPTQNGSWDYDFSQKVNKNLTIQWKEN